MSLRDQILSANDIIRESVTVPEWKAVVEVRSMTGAERTRILEQALEDDGGMNLQKMYPQVVIASSFDPETGEQLFTEVDAAALQAKNAIAVDRIAKVGLRLGGFDATTDADAEGKDSSSDPTDGSSSA